MEMTGPPEFESLVDLYSAELYGYLWRIFGTAPEAEDCLQETFLRAYRAYPRVEKNSNLRAWLYKIATNTANTRLRQQARLERRTVATRFQYDATLPIRKRTDKKSFRNR